MCYPPYIQAPGHLQVSFLRPHFRNTLDSSPSHLTPIK